MGLRCRVFLGADGCWASDALCDSPSSSGRDGLPTVPRCSSPPRKPCPCGPVATLAWAGCAAHGPTPWQLPSHLLSSCWPRNSCPQLPKNEEKSPRNLRRVQVPNQKIHQQIFADLGPHLADTQWLANYVPRMGRVKISILTAHYYRSDIHRRLITAGCFGTVSDSITTGSWFEPAAIVSLLVVMAG